MPPPRDARPTRIAIVTTTAMSLVVLAATPTLAATTVTAHWWIVVGALTAAIGLFQGTALVLVQRGRPRAGLILSLAVGWAVISTATSVMWVVQLWLLLGLVVIAQQIGRVRPQVLLAESLALVGALVLFRNQTVHQVETGEEFPAFEVLLLDFLVVGVAALISWRVWVDDVRLLRAAAQLRASRRRVVESADALRRSVERDLHDGAQQRVVAAAINVSTARRLVTSQPDRADAILGSTIDELDDAAAQLSDVSHGIYPAELARDGLDASLRGLAARSPLPVTVRARHLGRRSADVEAAVYFCCAEAVQNAIKHAGVGSHIALDVQGDGRGLSVTIADDGAGFEPGIAVEGHGLTNMLDRISAVGGTVRVDSAPGRGTTIRAHIPPPERVAVGRPARTVGDGASVGRKRPSTVRRLVTGAIGLVATVAAFAAVYHIGQRVVTSVGAMREIGLAALLLVVPLLGAAWCSRQPWRTPLAALLTLYWLAVTTVTVAGLYPYHVWLLVLALAVLTVPGAGYQRSLLALAGAAMVLSLMIAMATHVTMTTDGWTFPPLPNGVEIMLLMVITVAEPVAFAVVAARAIRRQRSATGAVRDLRASRLRLVESADAVRRSLERDLHDGSRQRLVGAIADLSVARRLLSTQPDRVDPILEATVGELQAAASQLRDVSHGIYPAELTRDGLDAALRGLAARSPLPLTVRTRDVRRRPSDIAAAVYFCCAEAVQNAAAHAGTGASVVVDVDGAGPGLTVAIGDNGTGFDPGAVGEGPGLTNMLDRIGAVGGSLTIDAAPGRGTTIRAYVPSPEPAADGRATAGTNSLRRPGPRRGRAARPRHGGAFPPLPPVRAWRRSS
jgi:signal transduction histidine kinase